MSFLVHSSVIVDGELVKHETSVSPAETLVFIDHEVVLEALGVQRRIRLRIEFEPALRVEPVEVEA